MLVTFRTFGCKLNQAETTRLEGDFSGAGWRVVPYPSPADVVVIHGCAVTRTAERECLRLARSIKHRASLQKKPEPFVVLVGCVVEANATRPRVTGVDLLVPREDKERLVERVANRLGVAAAEPVRPHALPVRAPLKVQDGCDFHCAYCIVPHTRGAPTSRPWQAVLDEAHALTQRGVSEIVITGCNLACYRDQRHTLPDLVAAVAALDDVVRVRLGSIEPATGERELVDLMASCPKLCRHLHLPLQSGDAGVLRAMGRRYTPEAFADTVHDIVRRVPNIGLGTDVITGFPGETPAAFENTRRLLAELPFSNLHVFPFSERPGTPAATSGVSVPIPVRKARAAELIALRTEKRQAFAMTRVGRPVEVVIEHRNKEGCGHGWSSEYLDCRVAGVAAEDVGRLLTFHPTAATKGMLTGSKS